MNYREIEPGAELQPYIKCFWLLQGDNPLPGMERVFPDGCMELIFNLATPFSRYAGNNIIKQPQSFIMGQITGPHFLTAPQKTVVIGVRFHPWGLAAFTRFSPKEFTGIEVSIEQLWGREAKVLEEKICAGDVDVAIKAISRFLYMQLKKYNANAWPSISTIIGYIKSNENCTSVNDVLALSNVGERQFNRKFNECIGISPKEFIKITRFNRVLQHFIHNRPINFSQLAQQCGYYDQAHFSKDFREYTGTTPGNYAGNNQTLIPLQSYS